MTVLVKKVFISSKPSIVCLLCPPPCEPFSIQESAVGGLSYKVKKNPALQDSPPAAGRVSDILPFRRSAILAERLLSYGNEVSYTIIRKDSGARRSLFSSSLDNRIFTQRAFCCFHMIFDGIGLHDIQVIAHVSRCIHLFCAELFILRMELCTVCLYHVIDPV